MTAITLRERLLSKINIDLEAPDGVNEAPCWLWTGAMNTGGYGSIWVDRRGQLAHRLVWEMFRGPIPDGMELDHLCRVHACVNPDHLEPVAHRVNVLRGLANAAVNAARTHCQNGHEFDLANTARRPDGRRRCRICRNAYERHVRAKGRATWATWRRELEERR